MAILIGGVWIILNRIDGIAFHGKFDMLGLRVYLIIAGLYLAGFVFCFLAPRIGMKRERWRKVEQKVGLAMAERDYSGQIAAVMGAKAAAHFLKISKDAGRNQAAGTFDALAAAGACATALQMTNEVKKRAGLVAAVCREQVPKAGKYVALTVLIPVIVMIAFYIPKFSASRQNLKNEIALASTAVYALAQSLEQQCVQVYYDDPQEGYRSSGYWVSGYLYEMDQSHNSYVFITVGNDGTIEGISYYLEVDVDDGDKRITLEKAQQDLFMLSSVVQESGVEAVSQEMVRRVSLPAVFQLDFIESSYYEEIQTGEGASLQVYYMTAAQEEYDPSDPAYICVSINE